MLVTTQDVLDAIQKIRENHEGIPDGSSCDQCDCVSRAVKELNLLQACLANPEGILPESYSSEDVGFALHTGLMIGIELGKILSKRDNLEEWYKAQHDGDPGVGK